MSSGVFPGWRGLCSGKPRETPANCPPGVDLRETTQPADRPSDLGQGLFKFKELVGGVGRCVWQEVVVLADSLLLMSVQEVAPTVG